jgi:hypothetical protein
VSGSVHTRLLQRTIAQQWVEKEFNKVASSRPAAAAKEAVEGNSAAARQPGSGASVAAAGTNAAPDSSSNTGDAQKPAESNREQIKLSLVSIKPKTKKSKKRPRVMLDD